VTSNLTRRSLFAVGTATAAGLLAGPATLAEPTAPVGADDSWRKLADGNARFATDRQIHPHQQLAWRQTLLAGQQPFACVLGCADSRVSPELVFDHGLGDLFTVRTVGEVLDDAVVGSIEYAVAHLNVPLVVVLGHAGCGAVKAAIELVNGSGEATGAVSTVARAIEATVRATPAEPSDAAFLAACVRNQARRVGAELTERSAALRESVRRRSVVISSAVYDLRTGEVRLLA
jgi:carbonic anhydrase